MHLNEYFEAVFCINLVRRPDRRAEVEAEFAKHGIKVEFVDGVDGKELGIGEFQASDNEKGTAGDIGCVLSHLKVLEIAMARNLKNYFVFEDDVELAVNFNEQFAKYITQLPEGWDMVYLGGNHDRPVKMVTENIALISRTFTTHAIGVSQNIYTVLQSVLVKLNDKVDLAVSSLHDLFQCYCFQPHIAFQRKGFSDILGKVQDYKHLRNYHYVPLGLRCSAAGMLVGHFARKMSLPFDWVDLPLTAIIDGISIQGDIAQYVEIFIASVDISTQRHPNGTWFPHDIIAPTAALLPPQEFMAYWSNFFKDMREKYTRRYKRLYNLFDSGDNLVFVTVIPRQDDSNIPVYDRIKTILANRVKGQCIFVTANLYPWEEAKYDGNNNLAVNVNATLGTTGDAIWAKFEQDIADRLRNYEHSKRFFK